MDAKESTNHALLEELRALRQRVAELEQQKIQWQSSSTAPFEPLESIEQRTNSTVVRILESMTDPFLALDHEWRFTYVNYRFEEISQRSRQTLLGHRIWDVFPEAVETAFYEQYHRAMAEQVAVVVEAPQSNGEGRWYEAHAYPYADGLAVYFRDVTDRKLVEQERDRLLELEQSARLEAEAERKRLKSVLMQLPSMIAIVTGPDHVFEFANPTYLKLTGRSSDIIGKPFRDVFPELEGQIYFELFDRIYQTGETFTQDESAVQWERNDDGVLETAYFHTVFPALRGADGQIQGVLLHGIEVTSQVRSRQQIEHLLNDLQQKESALKESEERLRLAVDSADLGMWDYNLASGALIWSERCKQIFGIAPDLEMTYERFLNALHPGDRGWVGAVVQRCISDREDYNVEYRTLWPDGSVHWIAAMGRVYYNSHHEPVRMAGVAVDITQRKQTEQAQRKAEKQLHYLSEISSILASSLDYQTTLERVAQLTVPELADWCTVHIREEDGSIEPLALAHIDPAKVEWAERLREKYPFNPNEARGTALTLRTGKPDLLPDIPDELLVQAARDPDHLELLRQVGFKSVMTVPLRSQDEILGVISFVSAESGRRYDERDLKIAEELARRASLAIDNARLYRAAQRDRAQAEAANRIKDEFLAVLSHELRTPLNPILGWTTLLRSREYDHTTVHRALETIERNARLQTQLIEDLLDISRILQGKLRLNIAPVDLTATIAAALETVRLSAEAKSIQLQTVMTSRLETVLGDFNRLQQVVWNLLSNAIKFTPQDGRVEVRLEKVDTYALMTVSDTGRGISADFLPFIFEAFRQADGKITRRFGGLGLGLSIARHLVELHGGSIRAESLGEGQGATFIVKLPLMVASPPMEQSSMDANQLIDLSGLRVLAVDDDVDSLELVTFILEQSGALVTAAKSATEALSVLEQSPFDILVSDIGMPGIDGYTLMQRVRSHPAYQKKSLPAIALTAYAAEYDQQAAIAAGFQLHIAKPVEPEELVKAVMGLAVY
ncbi:MAG TPA: PAS domain S-box protein [Crinalium sp.]|jgi:PAS domain S-box-containing protein